jgi:hypothetical protein
MDDSEQHRYRKTKMTGGESHSTGYFSLSNTTIDRCGEDS